MHVQGGAALRGQYPPFGATVFPPVERLRYF